MMGLAIGGFLGAVSRYAVYMWVEMGARSPKLATWLVNSSGSFVLGGLIGAGNSSAFWIIGFLGAFTTFSTMALDAVKDFEEGRWQQASLYLSSNLIAGVALFGAAYSIFQ
ncbi:MAG TPA: CrcB family protein [Planococcus sp. (in: firmicutes)]|nr:CrcB family protein [Planococcus sp. (in: firmicutes)]